MSWGAYITGEGGLLAQYDKIACGGIFGQNGSTFAQAQDRLLSRTPQIYLFLVRRSLESGMDE